MLIEDLRVTAIQHWLRHDLKLDINNFEVASSDASFRRYFRVSHQHGQHIVMDAPPDKENIQPFIAVAELFASYQLNVPDIIHQQLEQGFLLLEDFGSACFLDKLNDNSADKLYPLAMESLFQLQRQPINNSLPCYDEALLQQELNLFDDWYLQQLKQQEKTEISQALLAKTSQLLIDSALSQPQVCVHRDYHSRNLMVLDNASIGIIDFQDAVIGAITYDLVSLLRDCYIVWSEQQVQYWLKNYYQRLYQVEMIDCEFSQFQRWFDLMGIQRHLKAMGIFSRLALRDGKKTYLDDIPRTLDYVKNVSSRYPELNEFYQFLKTLPN